jgi:hypothetical protein
MSDDWMIVVPVDALAKPPQERIDAAFSLLQELRPDGDDPELHVDDVPAFFDCGSNFENVFCPFCEAVLESSWWNAAMNRWCEDQRKLSVETPCCHRETSLNELDYDAPQAFACVGMELMNPGYDLEPEERRQVEGALGLPVRIIWRHL